MKSVIMALMIAASVAVTGNAIAGNGHGNGSAKVKVCHNGHTLNVSVHAVPAHMNHGDVAGTCGAVSDHPPINEHPVVTPNPQNVPVTPALFTRVSRILACADRPILRVADNTMGISVDLDVVTFNSGIYGAAKFTVARYYTGVGATCDNLGGSRSGNTFVNEYPVWTR